MRIFNAFLIMLVAVILLLLPVTDAVYDFRTDIKEDKFTVETGGGESTGNVSLNKELYNADSSTITITSDLGSDLPQFSAYHDGTNTISFSGLTASSNRTITVLYDYDAISGLVAINTLIDRTSFIWYVMLIGLPIAGVAAIFTGRS